jgi:hypothetical protein
MEHGMEKPSIYGNLTEDCLILIRVQSSESNNSVIGKLKLLIAIIFSLRFYGCNFFLSFMISQLLLRMGSRLPHRPLLVGIGFVLLVSPSGLPLVGH